MFRRRRSADESDDAFETTDADQLDDEGDAAPAFEPPLGPWDSDDVPDDGLDRIDVGSLRIAALEGTELQLQVDEQTGEVQAAMLAAPDGALELRAFAAPRNSDRRKHQCRNQGGLDSGTVHREEEVQDGIRAGRPG